MTKLGTDEIRQGDCSQLLLAEGPPLEAGKPVTRR